MRYFDYEQVAREAGIPADRLADLSKLVRAEFPTDDMLYELHVLRACMAIRDGYISLEEALHPQAMASHASPLPGT